MTEEAELAPGQELRIDLVEHERLVFRRLKTKEFVSVYRVVLDPDGIEHHLSALRIPADRTEEVANFLYRVVGLPERPAKRTKSVPAPAQEPPASRTNRSRLERIKRKMSGL